MVPYAEKIPACWSDTGSAAAGATPVVAAAAPAFCAVSELTIAVSWAAAAASSSGTAVRSDIHRSLCVNRPDPIRRAGKLWVGVRAAVYWQEVSDPAVQSRDRKGSGDSRLRLLNADASSFNKLLSSDMPVSPGAGQLHGKGPAARGSYSTPCLD